MVLRRPVFSPLSAMSTKRGGRAHPCGSILNASPLTAALFPSYSSFLLPTQRSYNDVHYKGKPNSLVQFSNVPTSGPLPLSPSHPKVTLMYTSCPAPYSPSAVLESTLITFAVVARTTMSFIGRAAEGGNTRYRGRS